MPLFEQMIVHQITALQMIAAYRVAAPKIIQRCIKKDKANAVAHVPAKKFFGAHDGRQHHNTTVSLIDQAVDDFLIGVGGSLVVGLVNAVGRKMAGMRKQIFLRASDNIKSMHDIKV